MTITGQAGGTPAMAIATSGSRRFRAAARFHITSSALHAGFAPRVDVRQRAEQVNAAFRWAMRSRQSVDSLCSKNTVTGGLRGSTEGGV